MYFKESTHEYIFPKGKYESVSSILKLAEPKRDWQKIAEAYAKKHKMKVEDVQQLWEDKKNLRASIGSIYHNIQEQSSSGNINPVVDDIRPILDLRTIQPGWYNELTLYNHMYKACGTADRVFIEEIDGIKYADIYDYKTNENLDKVSYQNPRTGEFQMLAGPCSHMMDTKLSKYNLQLSLYGYFLECYRIIPRKIVINYRPLVETELEEESIFEYGGKLYKVGETEDIILSYLKDEAMALLKLKKFYDDQKNIYN